MSASDGGFYSVKTDNYHGPRQVGSARIESRPPNEHPKWRVVLCHDGWGSHSVATAITNRGRGPGGAGQIKVRPGRNRTVHCDQEWRGFLTALVGARLGLHLIKQRKCIRMETHSGIGRETRSANLVPSLGRVFWHLARPGVGSPSLTQQSARQGNWRASLRQRRKDRFLTF